MKKLLGICLLSLVLSGCASNKESNDLLKYDTVERYGQVHKCYQGDLCLKDNAITYRQLLDPEYKSTTYLLLDMKEGAYILEDKKDKYKKVLFMVNYEKEPRADIKSKSSLYVAEIDCDTKQLRARSVMYFSEHFLKGEHSSNRVFRNGKFTPAYGAMTELTINNVCK